MKPKARVKIGLLLLVVGPLCLACSVVLAVPAAGPLRVHPANPRYFADASGKPVYLTGAHTWNNLIDMGRDDPPAPFDFDAYLDSLERHHHNFIRLWAWDSTLWDTRANGSLGKDFVHKVAPLPWTRTGPGNALDGRPKFDVTKFDPAYFDRLRSRVAAAGRRGIYVSIMLFEGWCLHHANRGRDAPEGWAWRSHPFHPDNNVNDIGAGKEGDPLSGAVHSLAKPAVNAIQTAYIRKVVDTVNDLDNVLYEVVNEGGETEWDWWVIKTVRDYEKTKPKQHPIGLTGHGVERIDSMLASDADWVSPGRADGYAEDPPAWESKKVSLIDTDHVWGVGGTPAWIWKCFLRGHNPIFMDPHDGSILGKPSDPAWEPIRGAMGHARRLAERVDLAGVKPHGELSSTGYCLADAGKEYVMYQPSTGAFTVELKTGTYRLEWLKPTTGEIAGTGRIESSGEAQEVHAPFEGDAVLYLKAEPSANEDPRWLKDLLPRRIVLSVPGTEQVKVRKDLTYKRDGGTELRFDVYSPAESRGNLLPAVVCIHGGPVPARLSVQPKDWGIFSSTARVIAASGMIGVTFNHRFHGWDRLLDAERDVADLISHLRAESRPLGIDADRIALWAFSAGGIFLGWTIRESPQHVRCMVAYYSILDVEALRDEIPPAVADETLRSVSPLRQLKRADRCAPVFIARAGLDSAVLNSGQERFVNEALSQNLTLDLWNHARGHHGFEALDDDDRSREIIRGTLRFLAVHLAADQ